MLPQISLDRSAAVPLHHQLSDALRRLVLSGELPAGTRLPSTRRGARELGVSRNVIVLAYEQLQLEGILRSAVGVGTWVPRSLEPHLLRPDASAQTEGAATAAGAVLSARGQRIADQASSIAPSRPTHPFRPSAVASDHFPSRTWSRLAARMWRSRTSELVHYGDVQGYLPLRELIAEHLVRHRAVRCDADRILMTGGSQQSLDFVARMLLDPGDAAAMEDPGYHGASGALAGAGARLLPVPVDENGADLRGVRESLEEARLFYTTPSHQYPLGVTMPVERRLAWLEWARRTGGWIIEDDYDSEFRYEARPLPAVQGLDSAGRVLYIGTFSKVLAPSLRIGFIVLPPGLVEPFVRARGVVDHHPPIPLQATLAAFMAEGHLERHIVRMRSLYAERREALRHALGEALGDRAIIVAGSAGLHMTLLLEPHLDDTRISLLAQRDGIDAQPLSVHYLGPDARPGLVLGYGGFSAERLTAAVSALRGCVERASAGEGVAAG